MGKIHPITDKSIFAVQELTGEEAIRYAFANGEALHAYVDDDQVAQTHRTNIPPAEAWRHLRNHGDDADLYHIHIESLWSKPIYDLKPGQVCIIADALGYAVFANAAAGKGKWWGWYGPVKTYEVTEVPGDYNDANEAQDAALRIVAAEVDRYEDEDDSDRVWLGPGEMPTTTEAEGDPDDDG